MEKGEEEEEEKGEEEKRSCCVATGANAKAERRHAKWDQAHRVHKNSECAFTKSVAG